MSRLLSLMLILLVGVAGCSALQENPEPPVVTDDRTPPRDLTGSWNMVYHYEIPENILIPAVLVISDMRCLYKCTLNGYIETNLFGNYERYPLETAVYDADTGLIKLTYEFLAVNPFSREVVIFIDDVMTGNAPERSMTGHFVIYSKEASAQFYTQEDGEILQAARKGKVGVAGQITLWPMPPQE